MSKLKTVSMIFFMLILTSVCAACKCTVNTRTVQVEITAAYVKPDSYTPKYFDGKLVGYDYKPAQHIIEVAYEDEIYKFYDQEIYLRYYKLIGESVYATLETKSFENGVVWTDIVALWEVVENEN